MNPIVLASGSAYRAELLRKLRLDFSVRPANIDEGLHPDEAPGDAALRLARNKALALADPCPRHLIIGSDQIAVCGGNFLNKPGGREQAISQLQMQSGRSTRFYTAVSILDSGSGRMVSDLDISTVHFKTLSDSQIERYVDIEQPYDCAGSFKSEVLGIALFSAIEATDPNALIGLPLIKLVELLSKFDVRVI